MQKETIITTIKQFLIDDLFVELPPESIGLDDGLQSKLGLDSVSFTELRIGCEQTFNIEITDADFNQDTFSTINQLVALIQRLSASSELAAESTSNAGT